MSSKPCSANSLGGLVLGVLPEIAQLQSLSDSHGRKEKAMRLKICILAVYVLAMSTSSFGDVLVSNFFDDNASDRGSITSSGHFYEVNCVNFQLNDNDPCDNENDKLAMSFTVGGEFDYAFEGVQIEMRGTGVFEKVNVYLDKGDDPGTEVELLSYAGDAGRKASDRYRGTFRADDLVLETGEKYWVRIERKRTEEGKNTLWVTDSSKQEAIDSGWDIGNKFKFAGNPNVWHTTQTPRKVIRLAVLGREPIRAKLAFHHYDDWDGKWVYFFDLRLSEALYIPNSVMRENVFSMTNGRIVKVERIHKSRRSYKGRKRSFSKHWRLGAIPIEDGDISVTLAPKACGQAGAICNDGGPFLGTHILTYTDAHEPLTLTLSANDPTGTAEGNSWDDDNMLFTVELSRESVSHIRFMWEVVAGTATPGEDYRPANWPVFLLPRTESQELGVYLVKDDVDEEDETVFVRVYDAHVVTDGGDERGPDITVITVPQSEDGKVVGTILNDD